MDRGHSSLALHELLVFRARLSCPHQMASMEGSFCTPTRIFQAGGQSKNAAAYPSCLWTVLTITKFHFDRTHTLHKPRPIRPWDTLPPKFQENVKQGKLHQFHTESFDHLWAPRRNKEHLCWRQVALVLFCLQIVDGFPEPFHLSEHWCCHIADMSGFGQSPQCSIFRSYLIVRHTYLEDVVKTKA